MTARLLRQPGGFEGLVKAFTSKNDASAFYFGGATADANDTDTFRDIDSDRLADGTFDTGVQLQIDNSTPGSGNNAIGTLNYSAPDGSVVVAHLAFDELIGGGGVTGCALTGTAIGG